MQDEGIKEFEEFTKKYFGSLAALSGIPILADFIGLTAPGKAYPHLPKAITGLTALACALALIVVYSSRYVMAEWSGRKFILTGIMNFVPGGLLIGLYCKIDEIPNVSLPEAIGAYVGGLVLSCIGATMLLLYAFLRRDKSPSRIILGLTPPQLVQLETIARAMRGEYWVASLSEGTGKRVHDKFKEQAVKSVDDAISRISRIRDQELQFSGTKKMENVYADFAGLVRKSFRAVSNDDFRFWASKRGNHYLKHNFAMIERDASVERIFLIPRLQLPREHCEALKFQLSKNIRVRIALYSDVDERKGDPPLKVDFGLLDGFAVSFWDLDDVDRQFDLSIKRATVESYSEWYEEIKKLCVEVPGNPNDDPTLFKSAQDLDSWLLTIPESGSD